MTETKICCLCKEPKPVINFGNNLKACEDCRIKRRKVCERYRRKNLKKVAKQHRKLYARMKKEGRTHYQRNESVCKTKSRQRYLKRIQKFEEFKATQKCTKCPENHPACLDFHHRDPKQKTANIATIARYWPWPKVLEELKKCDCLCANCHRKLHFQLGYTGSKINRKFTNPPNHQERRI